MTTNDRLHALDAVRAFALLLGIAFHAAIAFVPGMPPGVWATLDNAPSVALGSFGFVAHMFRMSLFFFVAGFFAHLLLQKRGVRGFWINRLKRIALPLIVGWMVLYPAIMAIWIWGLTDLFAGKLPSGPPPSPPKPFAAFPLLHLWFLYLLLVLYAAVFGARHVALMLDRRRVLRAWADGFVLRALNGYWAPLVLGLPLVPCLILFPQWVYWQGIPTPDQSLVPNAATFVGYGTAIVFGWLVHRQVDQLQGLAARWRGFLVMASIATAVCLGIVNAHPAFSLVKPGPQKIELAVALSLGLWAWVFAVAGVALRYLSGPSPVRRYIADSSYWLYLAHLPIVAIFNVEVSHWRLHWAVKYSVVLVGSLAVLFASYHLLVRPTSLGEILNGRKSALFKRRPALQDAVADELPSSSSVVAELRGVGKSYGKSVALDGVDLQVKRGELLAMLGPNGAGKTTAISLWLGLVTPDRGTAILMGGSPLDVDSRRRVGVMMQEVELTREMRVVELIALTSTYYPNPLTVEQTLKLTRTNGLAHLVYGKLSGGQKRQVQFALAVCGRPELLFLDEPTVGLDVQARETMWSTIRELIGTGCSIVLTTHYLEEAEALADRVIVLAKSHVIASGSVQEMRSLVSRRQIVCETSLSPDEVSSWPGVIQAIREARRLKITAIDAESVVRRLLAADERLSSLEVRQAGLSEAFTELTKEAA